MPAFNELSEKQKKIIKSRHPECLILAGPGTGKTEILAHRIVDIISFDDVEPNEILALTFSRKATAEMRKRLNEFTEIDTLEVNISTIHAESLRIYHQLGGSRIHILDDDELNMLTRDALNDNGFPSNIAERNRLKKDISLTKSNNILPDEIQTNGDNNDFVKLYKYYENLLEYHNAMDFNDVILKTLRLLNDNESEFDRNIKHLLIDEFQDINELEFSMLQILAKNVECLFIVGDDDQSIYGFRNANPLLIKTINKFYASCIVDCLDETHRCCEHIIRGALEIVSNDTNYVPKPIHSAKGQGNPIKFIKTKSEGAEAEWVAQWIKEKINEGYVEPQKIGILAKSLMMIPPLLVELRRVGVNATRHVSGGVFRHKAVRDILTVCRIMLDSNDNLAFRKCLDTNLAAGIGRGGVSELRNIAEKNRFSYWNVINSIETYPNLRRWKPNFESYKRKIDDLFAASLDMTHEEVIKMIGETIGVLDKEGVDELIGLVNEFGPVIPFKVVLATIQNNRGIDKANGGANPEDPDNAVALMTMHSSKGLTYDIVFIIGMDQEIMPDSTQEIDEQRRLCYVAMTRARNDLILCHTRKRTGTIARGVSFYTYSKFINEISAEHIEVIDLT